MADAGRTIAKGELTRLLASALGREKGDELVSAAAHALGFPGPAYSPEEARAIFAHLATIDGLIGVIARFALSRGEVDALAEHAPPSSGEEVEAAPAETIDLLPLLAPALGTEKARDATTAAAHRLGLDARSLSREQAMAVLDELAREGGIVGVVARFARSRLVLG